MGIPLRRGRVFSAIDTSEAPRVTVISETAARRFWPNGDPIGQRVGFGGGFTFDSPQRSATIVGIVAHVVYAPLDQRPNRASFYTPYTQFTYPSRMVFVRTAGDPMAVVSGVRRAVASVDPEVSPQEPRVFVGTAVLLLITAAAACVVPAWRATRTDPMEALRAE